MNSNKLNDCINKICDNEEPVRLSDERISQLRASIRKEKPKRKFGAQLAGFATSLACFVTCIVVPVALNNTERYYGENDVEQEEIANTFFFDFINTNYPQYNFIQEDCDIENVYGYYSNDNHTLLAISSDLNKKDIPFTTVEFNLVMTNKYVFKYHSIYIDNAEITQYDNYTIYIKSKKTETNEKIYYLLEYSNYKLYLYFNLNDENFLEKFL